MPKFKVRIYETQHWVYEYEVECNSDNALLLATELHNAGGKDSNNWLDESSVADVEIEEEENA